MRRKQEEGKHEWVVDAFQTHVDAWERWFEEPNPKPHRRKGKPRHEESWTKSTAMATGMAVTALQSAVQAEDNGLARVGCEAVEAMLRWLQTQGRGTEGEGKERTSKMYDVAFKYAFKAAKIYLDRKDAVYDPWGTKLCRLCVQCGAKVMEREPDAFRAGLELCKSIPEDIRLKVHLDLIQLALQLPSHVAVPAQILVRTMDGMIRCGRDHALPAECMPALRILHRSCTARVEDGCALPVYCATVGIRCMAGMDRPKVEDTHLLIEALQFTTTHLERTTQAWKENRDKGASQRSDDDDDDDKGTDAVSLLLRGMLLYNETYRGEGFLRTREKWERSTTKHRKSAANEAASLHRTIVRSAMVLCGSYIHPGVPSGTLVPGASEARSGRVNEAILVILKGMEREGRETGGTHGLADGLSNLDLDASVAPEPSGDDFFRRFLEENGHKLLDASTRKHLFEFLVSRASEVKGDGGSGDPVTWLVRALKVCAALPSPLSMDPAVDLVAHLSEAISKAACPMQQWQRVLLETHEELENTEAAHILMDAAISTLVQTCKDPSLLVREMHASRIPDELSFSLLLAHVVRAANSTANGLNLPEETRRDATRELASLPRSEASGPERLNVAMHRALPLLGTSAGTGLVDRVRQEIESEGQNSIEAALVLCCKAIFLHEESHPSFAETAARALDACEPFLMQGWPHPSERVQVGSVPPGADRSILHPPRVAQDLVWATTALVAVILSSGDDALWDRPEPFWQKWMRWWSGHASDGHGYTRLPTARHFFCVSNAARDVGVHDPPLGQAMKDLGDPALQLLAMQTLCHEIDGSMEAGRVVQATRTALDAMGTLETCVRRNACTFLPLLDLCRFVSGRLALSIATLLAGKSCTLGGMSKEGEQLLKQSLSLSKEAKATWLERRCTVLIASLYRRKGLLDLSLETLKGLKASHDHASNGRLCKTCCDWISVHCSIIEADVLRNKGRFDRSLDRYQLAYQAAKSNDFRQLSISCLLGRAKCLMSGVEGDDDPCCETACDQHEERCKRALLLVEEGLAEASEEPRFCLLRACFLVVACVCRIRLGQPSRMPRPEREERVRFWGSRSGRACLLSELEKEELISDLLVAYRLAKEAPLIHRKACGLLSYVFGCFVGDAATSTFFLHLAVGASFRCSLLLQLRPGGCLHPDARSGMFARVDPKHDRESLLFGATMEDALRGPEIRGRLDAQQFARRHLVALGSHCLNHPIVVCAIFSDEGVLMQEGSAFPVKSSKARLLLSRVDSDNAPILAETSVHVSQVKADGSPGASIPIRETLRAILAESAESLFFDEAEPTARSKLEWWKKRLEVESKMERLLRRMDQEWLGVTSCLFADAAKAPDVSRIAKHAPGIPGRFLSLLACHAPVLEKRSVIEFLEDYSGSSCAAEDLFRRMTFLSEANGTVEHAPVAFVPDTSIQGLPWESLPSMIEFPVVRSPSVSLNLIVSALLSKETFNLDFCKAFYLLDPEGNLPTTSKTFGHFLMEMETEHGWTGISGQRLPPKELHKAISKEDFFVYIGHGAPKKYLPYSPLKPLGSTAAAVLMGCSSARLFQHGCFEASGYILTLLLMGCPFVMGNLWDVTDRDIDKFSINLFRCWLSKSTALPKNEENEVRSRASYLEGMSGCRKCCKLPYLNGAAPVCYGVPCALNMSS